MPRRQLLIADPSLTDRRGHHYNLTRLAAQSAEEAGFEARWLVSRELNADLAAAHPEAIPAFASSMYDAYKPGAAPLPRRGLLQRLLRPRPAAPETAAPAPDLALSMLEGLLEGIEESGAGPADHLLFHTADGATYRAVGQLLEMRDPASLPIIHLCTPYDPVGVMPNRKTPEEVAAPIHKMEERGLLGSRVHLYAENDGLASHLSTLWEVVVSPLPLPVEEAGDDIGAEISRFRQEALGVAPDSFVVASLGAARLEKGFNMFPDIIRRTYELAGTPEFPGTSAEKIHFALHASPQIIGRHPVIAAALEKLEALGSDRVTLLIEPLSDLGYRTLLEAADAVCLPYNTKDYRVRSSGIVTEALAAGKYLIASSGSYPGHVAENCFGGTGETPMEMARSLLTLIASKEERDARFRDAVDAFRTENAVPNYIRRLKGITG